MKTIQILAFMSLFIIAINSNANGYYVPVPNISGSMEHQQYQQQQQLNREQQFEMIEQQQQQMLQN